MTEFFDASEVVETILESGGESETPTYIAADTPPYRGLEGEESFWAQVKRFREKAQEFARVYDWLVSKRGAVEDDPALNAETAQLLERGQQVRASIRSVGAAIDRAREAVKQFGGDLAGMTGDTRLGIAPVLGVVIVTITGTLAFISKWLIDAYALGQRIEERERLIGEGFTPEQVRTMQSRPGLFGDLTDAARFLVIGLVIWWAWNEWGRGS